MALAFGSASRPVDLDPFRRIVEVHWAAPWVAARFDIGIDVTTGGELGPGGGPPFVEPFSFASATAVDLDFEDPSLTDFQLFSGGDWQTTPDTFDISGTPSFPGAYGYPLWTWQGINAFGLQQPVFRYQIAAEGAALPDGVPPVPGRPDLKFTDGFGGTLQLRAQAFVGDGPFENPIGGPASRWMTADSTGVFPDLVPVLSVAEESALSASGMTLMRAGKAYVAFGSKIVPPASESALDTGAFWVLFKREAVTA